MNYPVGRALTGEDGRGNTRNAHIHERHGHQGLVVYTHRDLQFNPEFRPFLNPTLGVGMNTDAAFGGSPEIIHNGGSSTEWTASAVQGTWDFATGTVITQAGANDQDAATFAEESPTTIDISTFTALSGVINLNTYLPANHTMSIEFDLAGVQVGDTLLLDDYIDTGNFAAQNFTVPLVDFDFLSDLIDGFTITINRTGGSKPAMTFDDITLQQTGGAAVFTATADPGTRFHVTEIRIAFADVLSAKVPVTTTQDHAIAGISYDKFMAENALANGVLFRRVRNGETLFTVPIRQMGDFLATGSNIVNIISDGTNTFITLLVEFPEPIILDGAGSANFLSFTISDDLSGLLQFTAAARGAVEI